MQQQVAPGHLRARILAAAAAPLQSARRQRQRRHLARLAAGVLGFASFFGVQQLVGALAPPLHQSMSRSASDFSGEGPLDLRALTPLPDTEALREAEQQLRFLAALQGDPQ